MGKISKSIRLITPVLSPPLREGPDRKTVEQKILYTCALVMCPGLEPVLLSGRLSCHTPVALRWGHGECNGSFTRHKNRIVVVARRDNKTKNTLKIRMGEIP